MVIRPSGCWVIEAEVGDGRGAQVLWFMGFAAWIARVWAGMDVLGSLGQVLSCPVPADLYVDQLTCLPGLSCRAACRRTCFRPCWPGSAGGAALLLHSGRCGWGRRTSAPAAAAMSAAPSRQEQGVAGGGWLGGDSWGHLRRCSRQQQLQKSVAVWQRAGPMMALVLPALLGFVEACCVPCAHT